VVCPNSSATDERTRKTLRADQWLLIEWEPGLLEPTKYFLATLPASCTLERLVSVAKMRWRIERDYQMLKQEVGLNQFEGRSWTGFHHHATLCIATYSFLTLERLRHPRREKMCVDQNNLPFRRLHPDRVPSECRDTLRTRSKPSAGTLPTPLREHCHAVRVAAAG